MVACSFERSAGPSVVIRDRLKVVGLRKKNPLVRGEMRIIPGELEEFVLNAAMGLGNLARKVKNNRLRSVKSGQISGTRCIIVKMHAQHD